MTFLVVIAVSGLVAGSLVAPAYGAGADVPKAGCVEHLNTVRPSATAGRTRTGCVQQESVKLSASQRTKLAALMAKDATSIRKGGLEPAGPGTAPAGHRVTAPSRAVSASSIDEQCASSSGPTWYKERFRACRTQHLWVDIRDARTLLLLGQLSFLVADHLTFWRGGFWTWNTNVLRETAWGQYQGTTINGTYGCSGPCSTDISQFPTVSVDLGGEIRGYGEFHTTLGPDQVGGVIGRLSISTYAPATIDMSGPVISTTDDFRCDTKFNNAGCVYPEFPPVFFLDGEQWPTVAEHVVAAQESGALGEDWPLHRTTDQARIGRNRDIACPEMPRPPGKSCDEYPMASTQEGAAFGGDGRTFQWCDVDPYWWPNEVTDYGKTRDYPNGVSGYGWSFCMVDIDENGGAGRDLQAFYQENRVLDGNEFYVDVG